MGQHRTGNRQSSEPAPDRKSAGEDFRWVQAGWGCLAGCGGREVAGEASRLPLRSMGGAGLDWPTGRVYAGRVAGDWGTEVCRAMGGNANAVCMDESSGRKIPTESCSTIR